MKAAVDARRLAYRAAVAVQWVIFLTWGWAIWHEWDIRPRFWLAFGVAMAATWYLRPRIADRPYDETSRSGSRDGLT